MHKQLNTIIWLLLWIAISSTVFFAWYILDAMVQIVIKR